MKQDLKWAYEVLDSPVGDRETALKKFKELARTHHPDLGGNADAMKNLNTARDLIENSRPSIDFDAIMKKNEEIFRRAADSIEKIMRQSASAYVDHFAEFFDGIVTELIKSDVTSGHGHLHCKWSAPSGSTVFRITFFIEYPGTTALGDSNAEMNYGLCWNTEAFHENRTYKIRQRSMVFNQLSSQIVEPEAAFPKKSLQRISSKTRQESKMMRRDFESALKFQMQAKRPGEWWYIPLKDETRAIALRRYVFLKQPRWQLLGLYEKLSGASHYNRRLKTYFKEFSETEQTLEILKKYVADLSSGQNVPENLSELSAMDS